MGLWESNGEEERVKCAKNVLKAQALVEGIWAAPETMAHFKLWLSGYQVNWGQKLLSVNDLMDLRSLVGCSGTDLAADSVSDPC